jgi:hypothetical protein
MHIPLYVSQSQDNRLDDNHPQDLPQSTFEGAAVRA